MVTELITMGNECNLNCVFCGVTADTMNKNLLSDSNTKFIKRIKECKKRNVDLICLTGGEPTYDKELLLKLYHIKKNRMDSAIITNGIRLSNLEFTRKLKYYGLKIASVSLHGDKKEIHDRITEQKGSFDKTVLGIKNLISEKIETHIILVISSLNYMFFKDYVAFIHKEFPRIPIYINYIAPIGVAKSKLEYMPKISETLTHIKQGLDFANKNRMIVKFQNHFGLPQCFFPEYENNFPKTFNCFFSIEEGTKDECTKCKREHCEFSKIDKMKFEKCNSCEWTNICTGWWKKYIEIYGNGEFK